MARFIMEDDDVVWIDHQGVARETDKAKLVDIHDEKTWVPKSVIVDENEEHIGVKGWWARQRGIDGDW